MIETINERIKRADWVKCPGFPEVGTVKRLARDGSWADVNWGWHSKRMPASSLQVQHTLDLGGGWTVTDMDRERELKEQAE